MGETVLSRAAWRRQQAILWAVSLLGGGGLSWWIISRDWPAWAKFILLTFVGAFFTIGCPGTYKQYLRQQQEEEDYADLLEPGRSGLLTKCRNCGRHTYAEAANCVRCNVADPVPDAASTLREVRFLELVGRVVIAATAVTILYLLLRALVSAVG